MKKLLALILTLAMALSLVACGGSGNNQPTGDNNTPNTNNNTETPDTGDAGEETPADEVVAEALPANPLYYWGFEDTTNLSAVTQVEKAADSINDGATYDIGVSDHPVLIAEGQGAVGNALYLDGKYGVKLDDLAALADDSYTVSFWLNADRLSTYGPVLQMGRNMGDAGDDRTVTWLNVTKSTWGTNSADLFPVVWNRNSSIGTDISADGVWPWISAGDDMEHGKREWCLVTLVVDGNRYTADDSMERIGTKYYLNGALVFDASAEFMFYQGVSPEILIGDGVEGYIGINYWDTMYKGYIDELYIYDEALTAGQVLTMFQNGNPPAEPVAPAYEGAEEEPETEPEPLAAAPVDAAAIDTLGTPERVLGWWSDNTDGFELANGATLTLKMNNYSDGVNNWDNFVLGFVNTEVKTDLLPNADNYAGYAEYAVLRADAFGWGDAAYAYAPTVDWTDWAAWLALMTDAEVTVSLTRNDGVVAVNMTFVGADGTTMTSTGELTSTMTADSPVYVFIGGEGSYIELLSVE